MNQLAQSAAIPSKRRLAAIRVLHTKIHLLTKDRKAAASDHGKAEKDALDARDALIEEDVPATKQCRERMLELQKAHARLKTVRGDKKRDLDERAQKIAEFEGYLTEAITSSVDEEQTSLNLGPETMSIGEGLALTPGAIKAIGAAASDQVAGQDPDAVDPEIADLLGTIAAMGLGSMTLGDGAVAALGEGTTSEPEQADEDEETPF
jgi:hypothetical protein